VSEIKDTARAMREDPAEGLLALAIGAATGSAGEFITHQERSGQRELVNSDRLPTDMGDQDAYEALGFTFGDPDERDPMFRPAALPPGWKREGSDHAMWSHIVDGLGRKRVAIFYKAAFYDRSAHMTLNGVHAYVWDVVHNGGEYVLDDQWATRETVLAALRAEQERYETEAAEFQGYAADEAGRDEKNRAGCARIAEERAATAAEWRKRADAFEVAHPSVR
jgi:hypothetical protein